MAGRLRGYTRRRFLGGVLVGGTLLATGISCSGDDDDEASATAGTTTGSSPEPSATPKPEKMTFMAGFRPQANLPFVAAYVAEEMGYFAEEALEVEIRHSGGGDEHIQLLLGGAVDVSTHLASGVLQQRTTEPVLPIQSFVLWGQRSPSGFVTLKESGIDTVKKFEGKRFGFKQRVTAEYLAMIESEGVDRASVQEVSVGFDPTVITSGQVDILAVFLNNEPNVLRTAFGKEVNVFDPADYGVEALGLTYVATEESIAERADLLARFTRATLKGARYAIENEDEAIGFVLDRMDAGEDQRAHQLFLFREDVRQAESSVTASEGIGWMTAEQWEANAEILLKYGVVTEMPEAASSFTTEFLEAAG